LTIKFTRPTLDRSRMCLANPMGLSCSSHARAGLQKHQPEAPAAYPSRFLSGTHKNYSLVDCPIYSVVKNRVAGIGCPRSRLDGIWVATEPNALLQPKVRSHGRHLGAQPQVGPHPRRGASGSMPRSIFAIRS